MGKPSHQRGRLHICWGRAGRADESIRNALDSTLALSHSPSAIRRHMIKAPQPPLCILRMHIHFRGDGRDKAGGRKRESKNDRERPEDDGRRQGTENKINRKSGGRERERGMMERKVEKDTHTQKSTRCSRNPKHTYRNMR